MSDTSNRNKLNVRTGLEVAVIGMAGRFPGAADIESFWNNLKNGIESISFLSREMLEEHENGTRLLENPNYVNSRGGVLEGIELFDAAFFGYNPKEAEIMSPQLRIFHECTWEALETAGYNPYDYDGLIGLYVSASPDFYWKNLVFLSGKSKELGQFAARFLTDSDFIGTKVSHKLNLRGPSSNISTACSSSLVAIHMGCRALLSGDCDIVLAGGVAISPAEKLGYLYEEGMINSPDGHCRAFDARAKGTVGGEGIGIVVLKPLEDSLEDGDHILALIKGSAINNDGDRKVGYTAPSIDGQAEVICTALRLAEVEAETVSFVETHGTGTELGDPVEIAALKMAFNTQRRGYCALGAIKTNIGHLDYAAGVAGFIKAVLALKHRVIPPTLHYETPNPGIDFIESPFYVNIQSSVWENGKCPLRAGISSFGIGGTNAHVILEEAPKAEKIGSHSRDYKLILLSAKTEAALDRIAENFIIYLQNNPGIDLADVAYTLQVGREALSHRRMTVAANVHEVIENLSADGSGKVYASNSSVEKRCAVLMFSDYTSFPVEIGIELYRTEALFKTELDRCLGILKKITGCDIRTNMFLDGKNSSTDDNRFKLNINDAVNLEYQDIPLHLSEMEKPLIFSLQYSLAKLLMNWGIKPQALIGINHGELVAACVAEVIPLEGAINLLFFKSRKYQEKISRENIENIALRKPKIPLISSLSGDWITDEAALDLGYWLEYSQVENCLVKGLSELLKDEFAVFVDVGPSGIFSSLINQHPDMKDNHLAFDLVCQKGGNVSAVQYLLIGIGQLWISRINIDWRKFYTGEKRYRIPLPTYPFERQYYWIDGNPYQIGAKMLSTRPVKGKKREIAEWLYLPSWKRSSLVIPARKKEVNGLSSWLVFEDQCGLGDKLQARLRKRGEEVIIIRHGTAFKKINGTTYSVNPQKEGDYDTLFGELGKNGKIPRKIVHLWCITEDYVNELDFKFVEKTQDLGFYSLIHLSRAIGKRGFVDRFTFFVITNNVHRVTGEEELIPEKATLIGAIKVIPQEYANIICSNIDIQLPRLGDHDWEEVIDRLMREFSVDLPEKIIAHRANYRWLPEFESVCMEHPGEKSSRIKKKGVYLITGGLGGIGLEIAKYLASGAQVGLVLTSRAGLPTRSIWPQWLDDHDKKEGMSARIKGVQELEEMGAEVLICKADVAKLEEMQVVIQQAMRRFGQINGVIHTAGVPDGCVIPLRTKEMNEKIFAPKLRGTLVLDHLLKDLNLDFFILCSSLSSIITLFGQVGYCAANAFLDAFAQKKVNDSHQFTAAIDWDLWKEVGMGVDTLTQIAQAENIKDPQSLLANGMSNAEGIDVFSRIFDYDFSQVVVSTMDLHDKLERQSSVNMSEPSQVFKVDAYSGTLYPRPVLSTEYVEPRSEFEKTFAEILKKFFGYDQVGIHDNFFEFGVTSLTIIRINSLFRDEINRKIPIVVMFEYPTIASLGKYLEQEEKGANPKDGEVYRFEDFDRTEALLHNSISLLREDEIGKSVD